MDVSTIPGKLGPIDLPASVDTFISSELKKSILDQTGCACSVRCRQQWGQGRKLTVSGPLDQLHFAAKLALEALGVQVAQQSSSSSSGARWTSARAEQEQWWQRGGGWSWRSCEEATPASATASAPAPQSPMTASAVSDVPNRASLQNAPEQGVQVRKRLKVGHRHRVRPEAFICSVGAHDIGVNRDAAYVDVKTLKNHIRSAYPDLARDKLICMNCGCFRDPSVRHVGKRHSGEHIDILGACVSNAEFNIFFQEIHSQVRHLDGKYSLFFVCNHGHHRSVAMARLASEVLSRFGWKVDGPHHLTTWRRRICSGNCPECVWGDAAHPGKKRIVEDALRLWLSFNAAGDV